MRILVVDDDDRIAGLLRRALAEAGYAVEIRMTADSGLEAFEVDVYDLVILDLMMPGLPGGGIELCARIRDQNTDIPLLMLTALDSSNSRVLGLDAGADDYLIKPFHLGELLAKVRALLRRAPRADAPRLTVQDITLDGASRRASRDGRMIALTGKEFAVLEYLMRNAGHVVSVSELIDHAWDTNYEGYSNIVPTYIRYLRKKLAAVGAPEFIETRRGAGYLVRADG